MNDPWQILTLDRNTATAKDVKAAYARLLKQNRPDVDPEGFQRLRDAYQLALALIQDRDAQADGVVPQPEMVEGAAGSPQADPSDVASIPDLPEQGGEIWRARVEPLKLAVEQQNSDQMRHAMAELIQSPEAAAIGVAGLTQSLAHAFRGDLPMLCEHAGDATLIGLMRHGCFGLVHQVISFWSQGQDVPRLCAFGAALKDVARPLTDADSAMIKVRVGALIGFWRHEVATALADAAFPHLPTDIRQQAMAELDSEAGMGRLFFSFPPEMRRFWRERMTQRDTVWNWNDRPSRKAMEYVVRNRGHSWDGLPVIRQIVPAEVWQRVEKPLMKQASAAARASTGGGEARFSFRWILIIVILVGNAARSCGDSDSSRTPTRYIPPVYSERSSMSYDPSSRFSMESNPELKRIMEKFERTTRERQARESSTATPPTRLTIPVTPAR